MVSERAARRKFRQAGRLVESGDGYRDFNVSWQGQSPDAANDPSDIYNHRRFGFSPTIHDTLHEILADEIQSEIEKSFEEGTKTFESYHISNADMETTPLQYLEPGDIPHFERLRPLVEENSFRETSYSEIPTPDFQTIRLKDGTEPQIVAFQKFSRRQILGRTWKVKFSLAGEGEYDIFRDNLMGIPDSIDAVYFDDVVFVFNPSKFEDIFDYVEEYQRQTTEVLDGLIDSDINIHNFEEFRQSVNNDRRALRKMRKIRERGVYQELTQSDVDDIIDEFDLSISTSVENGEWGINIPDMRMKWDVIRILNDDHVLSYLADDRKYQVTGGKQEL